MFKMIQQRADQSIQIGY